MHCINKVNIVWKTLASVLYKLGLFCMRFGLLLGSHDQKFESHWSSGGRQVNSSVKGSVVLIVRTIVAKSQCYGDSVKKCLESRGGRQGSFFQLIGIGCPQCSVKKDSEVLSGSRGRNMWSDSICHGLGLEK